jgi:hypothetical protein
MGDLGHFVCVSVGLYISLLHFVCVSVGLYISLLHFVCVSVGLYISLLHSGRRSYLIFHCENGKYAFSLRCSITLRTIIPNIRRESFSRKQLLVY